MDDLLTFLHVVETSSVSAAAERLKISKSVVSKRVSDLETELGVQLFQRSGHRLFPTENAIVYSRRLCEIVADLDKASDLVAQDREIHRGRRQDRVPDGTRHAPPDAEPDHPGAAAAAARRQSGAGRPHLRSQGQRGYDIAIRMGAPRSRSLIVRKLAISHRVVCCSPAYADRFGLPQDDRRPAEPRLPDLHERPDIQGLAVRVTDAARQSPDCPGPGTPGGEQP